MSCHKPRARDKNKYVGVEIEFFSKYTRGYVETLMKKNKVLSSFCKLGTDGSINNPYDGGYGLELRVLCKLSKLKGNLTLVGQFLKQVGAEVNKSCGLHVHLDARHVDAKKMLQNLTDNLDPIEKSVPPYRLTGDYARSIKRQVPLMLYMIEHYKDGRRNTSIRANAMTGQLEYHRIVPNYIEQKYRSINIECMLKYKTIEVRCHEGTVNCAEIYKWCAYLCEVAYEGKVSTTNKTYISKRIKTKGEFQAKRIAS